MYRVAGTFRMVQNFAVFADRSAATKIRTTNFSSACFMDYWWVWSRQSASAKLRTTKFLLKGWEAIPRNFAPAKISRYTIVHEKASLTMILIC